MLKIAALVVPVVVALLLAFDQCQGGSLIQCSNPLITLTCCDDCIGEHYALSGACNPNDYCICNYNGSGLTPVGSTPPPSNITLPDPPIQQCQTNAVGGGAGVGYVAFCNVDCQCNHAASNGTCDFTPGSQHCHCNYPAGSNFETLEGPGCLSCFTDTFMDAYDSIIASNDSNDAKIVQIYTLLSISPGCSALIKG